MTVKELIEKLKEFPEDLEVVADTQDWASYTVTNVENKRCIDAETKEDGIIVYLS